MKPIRTWIVIADGARARVLLHDRSGGGIRAIETLDFRGPNLPDRDIHADKPGRTFDSVGAGRHAMEPKSDPHRTAKFDFARTLATFLDEQRAADAFDRLVIAAAPATLGDLRAALSPALKAVVHAELPKDLTQMPNDRLADHFVDVLPVG
ncbi:MAG: host attachment protein [Pseudomonadota bacterium]